MKKTIDIPDGYTLVKVSDTEYKIVKNESGLPNSWEEFCKNYPIKIGESWTTACSDILVYDRDSDRGRNEIKDKNLLPNKEYAEAILALCQLIQLRDCYNEGWTPDWKDDVNKPCITLIKDEWEPISYVCFCQVFCFRSKALRDKFLENFRDLLDKIKPLYRLKKTVV